MKRLLLVVLVCAAPASAASERTTCGSARPRLESIPTAEGLVIAPDGTIYFSQPFAGDNTQFIARYRPPYEQPELRWADMGGNALGIILDPQRNIQELAERPRPGVEVYVTAASTLYEISPDRRSVRELGATAGANIDFGAGALSCTDLYVAGNRQGLRLFPHDAAGLDVPWHSRN